MGRVHEVEAIQENKETKKTFLLLFNSLSLFGFSFFFFRLFVCLFGTAPRGRHHGK